MSKRTCQSLLSEKYQDIYCLTGHGGDISTWKIDFAGCDLEVYCSTRMKI